MSSDLSNLINRLETVTNRLEKLSSSSGPVVNGQSNTTKH
jgi:hypothetical protein